jgi:hypothetical protein
MPTTTRTVRLATVAVTALLVGGFATVTAVASSPRTAESSTGVTTSQATADGTLAGDLAFNRDEERMARDLYRLLSQHHDAYRPFGMIAVSEQRHFDAVGVLLERYGVADPSAGLPAGTYADPTLQRLYERLRTAGLRSLHDAYQVGVTVENRDIADLTATLGELGQGDVRAVLTRLREGSRHHLAAFRMGPSGAGAMNGSRRWGVGPGSDRMGPRSEMGMNGFGSPNGSGQGPRYEQGWQGRHGRHAAGADETGACPLLTNVT